eukprot:CAMPEP_0174824056 /NCGR_PEP_ID=MMETSP1107-20130205/30176_1 /TAXON_ID=36770 /ORGANISM="Paraphysomonas vestita, Strain GFlagA" /LENGTH=59 /DNA_ID=CAMNT_0016049289 /DNA_START=9 /DNA_END=185 /DNA_ORIENTATION=-
MVFDEKNKVWISASKSSEIDMSGFDESEEEEQEQQEQEDKNKEIIEDEVDESFGSIDSE